MLNQISQKEEDKCWMVSLLCRIQKNKGSDKVKAVTNPRHLTVGLMLQSA